MDATASGEAIVALLGVNIVLGIIAVTSWLIQFRAMTAIMAIVMVVVTMAIMADSGSNRRQINRHDLGDFVCFSVEIGRNAGVWCEKKEGEGSQ